MIEESLISSTLNSSPRSPLLEQHFSILSTDSKLPRKIHFIREHDEAWPWVEVHPQPSKSSQRVHVLHFATWDKISELYYTDVVASGFKTENDSSKLIKASASFLWFHCPTITTTTLHTSYWDLRTRLLKKKKKKKSRRNDATYFRNYSSHTSIACAACLFFGPS